MPKLLIQGGAGKGGAYSLSEDAVTIGRDPSSQLVIPDRRVSWTHARIINDGRNYIVEDLASANGTKVNEAFVSRKILQMGDVIRIGQTTIAYVGDEPRTLPEQSEPPAGQRPANGDTIRFKLGPGDVRGFASKLPERMQEDIRTTYARLSTLYRVSNELASLSNLSDLLNKILRLVLDVTQADRSFILAPDDKTGEMVPRYSCTRDGKKEKEQISFSRTIINTVLTTGESILTSDAPHDERFSGAESVILHGIRSTMCAPLKAKGYLLGVIQVDTRDRVLRFNEDDLELLTAICQQASIAIENAKLFDEVRQANEDLFEQHRQLVEAAKLSAIGLLASGVVHDLGNPLGSISMGAASIEEMLAEPKVGQKEITDSLRYLKLIRSSVSHCLNLVHNLLVFARRDEAGKSPIDVNHSIEAALTIAQFHMKKTGIAVTKQLAKKLPLVEANSGQLQQVFLNMIINAMDAMEERGGVLTVTTEAPQPGEVLIRFADNGCGIPADRIDRIFEPLYTSKTVGKGTGLGLSISKDIVTDHKGTIEVTSAEAQGATFTIRLPSSTS